MHLHCNVDTIVSINGKNMNMNKFTNIIVTLSIVLAGVVAPVSVFAQVPTVEVEDELPTTTTEVTPQAESTPTAGVPETGIAPQSSKLLQNTLIFILGSSLGAGIGYGIVSYKKKRYNS